MLQGGSFDWVSSRKHSIESLKASSNSCCECCGHTRYIAHIYAYTHTIDVYISIYIGTIYALNATGSTSEIIRSEECIRLPVREPGKEWERRIKIQPREEKGI